MGGLTLNQREQARLETLNRVLQKELTVEQAAPLLGVSERHAWRLLAGYRAEGAAALAHRNRGRRPVNTTQAELKERVIELAQTTYAAVNHTHLAELLADREGLVLARSTVRSILTKAGMVSPRRRRPRRHRMRRERLPQEGLLLQIDGSSHNWLESRGPCFTLLLAVDDATGTVPWALFHPEEDGRGYFTLLRGIIERRGIPLALYSDRHSVFRKVCLHQRSEEEPLGREQGLTQFGRAMRELGVVQVFAWSPEAKGRVERVAGTFQDRLVTELRLAEVSTLAEANRVLWEYLPRYNGRFSVPAFKEGHAYRSLPPDLDLLEVLCFKHRRKVAKDNTVRCGQRTLQLLPGPERLSYAGVVVEVRERLDRSLSVIYQNQVIPIKEAPPTSGVLRSGNGHHELKTSADWARLADRLAWLQPSGEQSPKPAVAKVRKPTPRMEACWQMVQVAKRQGLSIRAVARVLGISRTTARKYMKASNPPFYHERSAQGCEDRELTESLINSP
jgi:transposase